MSEWEREQEPNIILLQMLKQYTQNIFLKKKMDILG